MATSASSTIEHQASPRAEAEAAATSSDGTVLVLGASGYIGSHLVPRLLAAGHRVRATSRHTGVLKGRGWAGAELVEADVLNAESLAPALDGVTTAYYLVHSMGSGSDFAEGDKRAAATFREAAEAAGVQRIIYLGGLQPSGTASEHLRSRAETGDVLRAGSIPVTELRAGIIVGAGSAGFEIIRDLVRNLPFMITPRWLRTKTQPIALDDLLDDLAGLLEHPETAGRIFDTGGPETLTYEDLLRQYAKVTRRRPRIVGVPVLTPYLSSLWLDLVTAVPTSIARPLVEGLRSDLLVRPVHSIDAVLPRERRTYRQAVVAALRAEREGNVPRRWTEGFPAFRGYDADSYFAKGERFETHADAPPEVLWSVVTSLGGRRGYFYGNSLWRLRGLLDRAVGGIGLRRGRRHPTELRAGDTLDFWRVVAVEPGKRLTLLAEMRVPGLAVFELEVRPEADGTSTLVTQARFHPRGVLGMAYWYGLAPAHYFIFRRMPRAMARLAEEAAASARA